MSEKLNREDNKATSKKQHSKGVYVMKTEEKEEFGSFAYFARGLAQIFLKTNNRI